MFIDVHCHLDYTTYGDLDALISACNAERIGKVITVGFDLPSSAMAKDIAEKYPSVYFTAGFHPTELKNYREGDLEKIEELCMHEKCVAVGEIGLDYHYPDTQKELQRSVFCAQLRLADRLNLPVQIHSRDCAEDMLEVLKENARFLKNGALMHCYSHSPEMAEEFLKLGMYFSFGGASTWKSNKKARRTLSKLPIDRILTETDSPYMPPQSAYGSFPNTLLAIPEILLGIADSTGTDAGTAENTVYQTAHKLFKKLS